MDSPEPGSPASSSDSPGIEDIGLPPMQEISYSNSRSEPYPSSGKRRMPMSNVGSSAKSRRREEASTRRPAASTSAWQTSEYTSTTRSSRDELLDNHIVDKIRADWGDPFDTSYVKNAS